jgi:hypothetical protein
MPIFDDRFARQNRCEPPPEFPLASPYTGIVHHLSGPSGKALTQIHPSTSGSVDDAPREALTYVHFHFACGFCTQTLALMLDSLVRVSRRVASNHYASILAEREPRSPQKYFATGYNTPKRATFPKPLTP